VSRPGHDDVSISYVTVRSIIHALIDPTYDGLDESHDDFPANVAAIVNSVERQEWILAHKDPDADRERIGSDDQDELPTRRRVPRLMSFARWRA
jgi:hypothetical protein